MPKAEKTKKKIVNMLSDRWWRLNNLYYIIDVDGQKVKYQPNDVQRQLYESRWYRNVVLKSRQQGITTFVCMLFLDACLFEPNKIAAIIAHTKEDASKFFDQKIKFAYDNLPDWLRAAVPARRDRKGELKFANNSIIYVSNSTRSTTPNYLHISELGKLTLNSPEKVEEIRTGTFPSMHEGNVIFIESTADGGPAGMFYDICREAENSKKSGLPLSKLDFKFHFFPWWQDTKNRTEPANVVIGDRLVKYYKLLDDTHSIKLDDHQKAWYAKAESRYGAKMCVQYPSYPDEAFKAATEGAYYREQFNRIRYDGRICSVPAQDGVHVYTSWDLGISDYTAIWFWQVVGREIHLIDYYENNNYGLSHYADILKEKGYRYGTHVGPHDLAVREIGAKGMSRYESALDLGINFFVMPKAPIEDGIEHVRKVLSICYFDESNCKDGITHMENYRKVWDERNGQFRDAPKHSKESHAADAFRLLAAYYRKKILNNTSESVEVPRIKNYTYI